MKGQTDRHRGLTNSEEIDGTKSFERTEPETSQHVQESSLYNRFSLHGTPCILPTCIKTTEIRISCSAIRDGTR
jgi:hypothetical protein